MCFRPNEAHGGGLITDYCPSCGMRIEHEAGVARALTLFLHRILVALALRTPEAPTQRSWPHPLPICYRFYRIPPSPQGGCQTDTPSRERPKMPHRRHGCAASAPSSETGAVWCANLLSCRPKTLRSQNGEIHGVVSDPSWPVFMAGVAITTPAA